MNSPARDIVEILLGSTSAVSLTAFGTDIFVGVQPKTPVNCVTMYNTGGYPPAPNYTYKRPTIQALVRNSKYDDGYTLAEEIVTELHGLNNVTVNVARYVLILAEGEIQELGIDERGAYQFSVNFIIHRVESTQA